MIARSPAPTARARRSGFTLLELLVSMVLGVVIISVCANFAAATLKASRGSDLRDGLQRDGRFIGMALTRDLQDAGIDFESTQTIGSVATRGDTVIAISVPYTPNRAEVYAMVTPVPLTDPLPSGGTCGARCIDIVDPGTTPFQLAVGDVALLQVQSARRLIVISAVTAPNATTKRISWAAADSLFTFAAGLTGDLRLRRNGVAVQKLNVTGWFRDAAAGTLRRADGFNATGGLRSAVAARGVTSFNARLVFLNGSEGVRASGTDADTTNDYNRIISVVARTRLKIEQQNAAVNGGGLSFRDYEWRITPRNLMFERNRAL